MGGLIADQIDEPRHVLNEGLVWLAEERRQGRRRLGLGLGLAEWRMGRLGMDGKLLQLDVDNLDPRTTTHTT